MKPSKLRRGARIRYRCTTGEVRQAVFVKRIPAQGKGIPAVNYLRFPEFAGVFGHDDDGTCQMGDYELARNGEEV